jgi:threonine/homoserine/homoserine lactone efflux protein
MVSAFLAAFATGLLLGGLVAAQVGPVTLLCVRTVLRGSVAGGAALGCGVAFVDFVYSCLGVAGAAQVLRFAPLRVVLGLAGAVVLVAFGVRTLASAWRVRLGAERVDEVTSAWPALRTGIVATSSNPLTIVSWAAVFGAASTAQAIDSATATFGLLAGVGLGSLAWYLLLVGAVGLLRRRMSDRALQVADVLAGTGLVTFGGVLGVRALRHT